MAASMKNVALLTMASVFPENNTVCLREELRKTHSINPPIMCKNNMKPSRMAVERIRDANRNSASPCLPQISAIMMKAKKIAQTLSVQI
jgi:hypothetical protein